MPWLDKVLMKNPVLLWLDRHGYTNISSNRLVQFALKHQGIHENRRKEGTGQSLPNQKDLLDKFLDARDSAPGVISNREVMSLGLTMIFAGAETTAVTLLAIFYDLLKNPRVYATLQTEISQLSSPVAYNIAQKLPYLDACIKESFRLYPAVSILPERVVPDQGATICGHFVPGGTLVGATPWVLHLDKDVFGADAHVYRPERWLDDEEKVTKRNRVLFTFGGGPHACLGKNIALMEIYKIVPEILKKFEVCCGFQLCDSAVVEEDDIFWLLTIEEGRARRHRL
jgi:cytochrome P450